MNSRRRIVIMIVAAVVISWGGITLHRGSYSEPQRDPASVTGFYIPVDLPDALAELDRIMGRRGRKEIMRTKSEDDMVLYHFGLGLWIRNAWGLAAGKSRLAAYFEGLGVYHPDDMSGIILDSYWRQVHGVPIDLEGQVQYYEEYWERENERAATGAGKRRIASGN